MTGGQSAVRMNDRHSFPVGGLVEPSLGPLTKPLLWPLSRFVQRCFPSLEPAER
jgi:hypothetical protein